jgi:glycosyltransferase involved in cell wall biosynthesis
MDRCLLKCESSVPIGRFVAHRSARELDGKATALPDTAPEDSSSRWPRTVALVHDFFGVRGGAERVAFELARIFPEANIYTSVLDFCMLPADVRRERVRTSALLSVLIRPRRYRLLLPALPLYFGHLDLRTYDLVISSSIAFSKAVRTQPEALHVCYCYTPNRYAWDLETYLVGSGLPAPIRQAARAYRPWLKRWDLSVARHPDHYIAVSRATQARIRDIYGCPSTVVNPFVDAARSHLTTTNEGFLLCVGRLVGYKRIDLAMGAAESLGLTLKVVGNGPAAATLRRRAGPRTEFLGNVPDESVRDLYARCGLVVIPGVEDFSLVALEAMAAGKPVVAFDGGGVKDSVEHMRTGILFSTQDETSLSEAILTALRMSWDSDAIRRHSMHFNRQRFRAELLAAIEVARREKFGSAT